MGDCKFSAYHSSEDRLGCISLQRKDRSFLDELHHGGGGGGGSGSSGGGGGGSGGGGGGGGGNIVYRLAGGRSELDPLKAAEDLLTRECQDLEEQKEARFVPGFFLSKNDNVAKAIVPKVEDIPEPHMKMARIEHDGNVRGDYFERVVFEALQAALAVREDKEVFVVHGLSYCWQRRKEEDGKTEIVTIGKRRKDYRECTGRGVESDADFMIVSRKFKYVVSIECKGTDDLNNKIKRKMFEQLAKSLTFFNTFLKCGEGWTFIKAVCVEKNYNSELCDQCKPFVTTPEEIKYFLAGLFDSVPIPNKVAAAADNTYRHLVRDLLYFRKLNGQITTKWDCSSKQFGIIKDVVGTAQNILFWNDQQLRLLDDNHQQQNRYAFQSYYGTGKTEVMKEKARRLAEREEKFVYVVVGNPKLGDTQTFLELELREYFNGIRRDINLSNEMDAHDWLSDVCRFEVIRWDRKCRDRGEEFTTWCQEFASKYEEYHVFIDEIPWYNLHTWPMPLFGLRRENPRLTWIATRCMDPDVTYPDYPSLFRLLMYIAHRQAIIAEGLCDPLFNIPMRNSFRIFKFCREYNRVDMGKFFPITLRTPPNLPAGNSVQHVTCHCGKVSSSISDINDDSNSSNSNSSNNSNNGNNSNNSYNSNNSSCSSPSSSIDSSHSTNGITCFTCIDLAIDRMSHISGGHGIIFMILPLSDIDAVTEHLSLTREVLVHTSNNSSFDSYGSLAALNTGDESSQKIILTESECLTGWEAENIIYVGGEECIQDWVLRATLNLVVVAAEPAQRLEDVNYTTGCCNEGVNCSFAIESAKLAVPEEDRTVSAQLLAEAFAWMEGEASGASSEEIQAAIANARAKVDPEIKYEFEYFEQQMETWLTVNKPLRETFEKVIVRIRNLNLWKS